MLAAPAKDVPILVGCHSGVKYQSSYLRHNHIPMPHLNPHHLEVFRAVARLGSITRASEELIISQPAVSEQVKQLELACGLPLFERLPRGVRLTQAGEIVYDYAERLFGAADELERTLADLRNLVRGRLRLGASMTIGQYVLPEVMGGFRQHYPGVQLSLVVGNSSEIVDKVAGRALGLGFVGGAPANPALTAVPYLVDEIVVIVAAGHELASQTTLSVRDLPGADWIARERGSATRSEAEACLAAVGIVLTPAMDLGSNEAVKTAVAEGLGFALISHLDVAAELAAGRLLERSPADWDSRRLFCVCYRKDRRLTRAERAFLGFIGCDPPSSVVTNTDPGPVGEEHADRQAAGPWEPSMGRFGSFAKPAVARQPEGTA